MILAIDIGNTRITFGRFEGTRLVRYAVLPTHPLRSANTLAHQVAALRLATDRAEEVLICSVVPDMTAALTTALRHLQARRIRIVGKDVKVPLANRYRRPSQVGQDRLVGAYAAWRQFRRACIVADFGTATTIDVVTAHGEYLGGVIAPGLELALDTLANKTALLPRVRLTAPKELLGRDTESSIRSGLVYGAAALCDGIVTQLKRRYAPKAAVVATGGAGPLIAQHAKTLRHLRPHLVLEGLHLLSTLK